ncbi:hypothetical protein [Parabacteroides distasonis]|uniref:hypothetical protein n=1 Tax=Parabacteroides distasonis TaxID=823 RepID=UPI002804EB0D|nr:hypothetical protein [Parabacteroides distasonis]WMI41424.1 hypothetical protein Q8809_15785 [Parabacteroides distasonis]
MTDISEFIPNLSAICTIYSGVLSGKTLGCEETLSMVAFYNSFPSVQNIEAGILDLVLKASTERMDMILKSLYSDLNRIVTLYKENSRYYDRRDLRWLWHQPLSFVEDDIRIQQEKTQEAWEELKEASNSYEMTPFNGMSKQEAAVLERRVNTLKDEYDKEKTILNNLYEKKKTLEDERRRVPADNFKLIYLKCHALLPVIEKYYNKPLEKEEEEQSERTDLFLSMSLLASVHELCNGRQFEDMSPIDFFQAFNLHSVSKPLKVRDKEKIRVCYLINQLSEKIKEKERRSEWIGAMLLNCGIESDYYRSKYREPISDLPSKKNKEFAEALKEILA